MYSHHQKTQSDVCLICFRPLLEDISFVHLIKTLPICKQCLDKFEVLNWHIELCSYPLHILYGYNDFFKSLLYQYKGLYDHALKDVFLCLFLDELKQKYSQSIIVVSPSSQEDNQVRGFAPMEEIAKTIGNHIFTGLYKKENYKQSSMTYEKRQQVSKKIGIKHGEMLKGKKVVIIDDVVTSSQTLRTCLYLVLKYEPESVEFLVLSTKRSIKELFDGGI